MGYIQSGLAMAGMHHACKSTGSNKKTAKFHARRWPAVSLLFIRHHFDMFGRSACGARNCSRTFADASVALVSVFQLVKETKAGAEERLCLLSVLQCYSLQLIGRGLDLSVLAE